MYGLLRPTTLAALVADLEIAREHSWMKSGEVHYLADATRALVNLVGAEDAVKMIAEFKEAADV